MNNRALVLDVEATGISDDAQATELGWCDVYFNEKGELQPSSKAFVQRCKPELPISFGSMAVTHIHDDELVNEPSHRDVIQHVVNDSVSYVIGHNIDYDMRVIGNAGVNRQFKRICTLAIARACYPVDTDHKLLAMLYMLDYEFAREHGKSAHSAKFDVMFCVRILRIMCINNNITNMEQLYQFSEHCRVPAYLRFGKHKGKHIDDVDLSYKQYMLGKGLDDPYTALAFERSVAKNLAQIAERNRIIKEKKDQEAARAAAEQQQQAQMQPQNATAPIVEDVQQPMLLDLPEIAQEANSTETGTNTPDVDDALKEQSTDAIDEAFSDSTTVEQSQDQEQEPTTAHPVVDIKDNVETNDNIAAEVTPLAAENTSDDSAQETEGDIKPVTVEAVAESVVETTDADNGVNPKAPKKKARKAKASKADVCTPPTPDDIPPELMSETEVPALIATDEAVVEDNNTKSVSTVPEQDDDFYKNPTKYDPMSKPSKADPLFKETKRSTDPYGTPTSDPLSRPL